MIIIEEIFCFDFIEDFILVDTSQVSIVNLWWIFLNINIKKKKKITVVIKDWVIGFLNRDSDENGHRLTAWIIQCHDKFLVSSRLFTRADVERKACLKGIVFTPRVVFGQNFS